MILCILDFYNSHLIYQPVIMIDHQYSIWSFSNNIFQKYFISLSSRPAIINRWSVRPPVVGGEIWLSCGQFFLPAKKMYLSRKKLIIALVSHVFCCVHLQWFYDFLNNLWHVWQQNITDHRILFTNFTGSHAKKG